MRKHVIFGEIIYQDTIRKLVFLKRKSHLKSEGLNFTFMDLTLDKDLTDQLQTFVTKK